MKKELVCIVCPLGCHLEIELDNEENIINVQGNTCIRGEKYAVAELTHPVRMVTSTVKLTDGLYHRLPVITSSAVPKDMIFAVMEEINQIEVCAPIRINDIIIENVCGLDTNIIASRSINCVEQ